MHDKWVWYIDGIIFERGKLKYLEQDFFQYHFGARFFPVPLYPPHIPHGLAWYQPLGSLQ
jgi:hypothetical protein